MRLFTHNFLQCHVKGCNSSSSYPLKLADVELEEKDAEFNIEFIRGFMTKIDWKALHRTVQELNLDADLPEAIPEEPYSEELLLTVHKVLLEVKGRFIYCWH